MTSPAADDPPPKNNDSSRTLAVIALAGLGVLVVIGVVAILVMRGHTP